MLYGLRQLRLKNLLTRLRPGSFKLRDESFGGEGLQSNARKVGEKGIIQHAYDYPDDPVSKR